MEAMRPKLLAENPEIKVTEVAKKCGELWGGLDLNANGSIEYAYSCSRDYEWGSS